MKRYHRAKIPKLFPFSFPSHAMAAVSVKGQLNPWDNQMMGSLVLLPPRLKSALWTKTATTMTTTWQVFVVLCSTDSLGLWLLPFTLQDRWFSSLFLPRGNRGACTENWFRLLDLDKILVEALWLGWSVHTVTPGNVFLLSFCGLLKIYADETKYELFRKASLALMICRKSHCFQKCEAAGLHEPLHV